jgi:nitrite reductase/ring-hydroxylating ferredoxin subunit
VALDLLTRERKAARKLIGIGLLAALPAVASGLSDWSDTELAEHRVGVVHAAVNGVALGCFAKSWWSRRGGGKGGRMMSLLGLAVAGGGGWLGGHLAYAMGVGVDTNAFQSGPSDWTAVEEPAGDQELCRVDAGGVGIALAKIPDGSVRGLADRCSHRGGPLSEGSLERGCVTCPWHGSKFDLTSGRAVKGPASVPQPTYETRRVDGHLEVRRQERRGLRQRSV